MAGCSSVQYIVAGYICNDFYVVRSFDEKMFSKTKEEQLKQFNSWNIDEDGLKITWNVGVKDYSGNPFAYNIQIFCTKHGEIPVRMLNGRCPHIDCPNHQKPTFEYLVKNDIESMLLYVQDKLKNGSSK